jgi:hypothetical protein
MKLPQILLLVDDAAVIFIVTIFGIRFHQTDTFLFSRLPYTMLPFLVAWIFFAANLRLYDPTTSTKWKQLWRVPVAVALAAPVGAALRSLWLNSQVVPIFLVVVGAAIAVGILISRSLFILALGNRWSGQQNG